MTDQQKGTTLMTDYPMVLYRDGNEFVWDGRPTDTRIVVDAEDHEAATADGWNTAADYAGAPPAPTLLDKPAKDIEAELADLTIEELESLKADETSGKSRKTVLAMLDAAIDAKLSA